MLKVLLVMLTALPGPFDAKAQLKAADVLFRSKKRKEALAAYHRANDVARKEGNTSVQVEALSQIARCYSLKSRLKEGQLWLHKARVLATPKDPLGWTRYLGVRGIYERERKDPKRAKRTFIEMYDYSIKHKLDRRALDAAHHVAIVAPLKEQIEWARKGIKMAARLKEVGWLAVFWNNLGRTYEDLKQYDKMLPAYLEARKFHHMGKSESRKLIADWAVGHGYRLVKQYDKAAKSLRKTLVWAEKRYKTSPGHQTAEWVGWCKWDLGETLVAQGQKDKGGIYMEEGLGKLIEAGIEEWWPKVYEKMVVRVGEVNSP